ncbi:MAG: hypothetical protein PHC54_03195 [Candidatus Omnitrophica bacterium]|nr:hypothetical protein [Candidatus Omnitrophota bacterium]
MSNMEIFIPTGGLVFIITSLIAVKVELAKRPTFKDTDERYKKSEVCNEIHKAANEKLNCIPEIKTKVTQIETKMDLLLTKNGIEYKA